MGTSSPLPPPHLCPHLLFTWLGWAKAPLVSRGLFHGYLLLPLQLLPLDRWACPHLPRGSRPPTELSTPSNQSFKAQLEMPIGTRDRTKRSEDK